MNPYDTFNYVFYAKTIFKEIGVQDSDEECSLKEDFAEDTKDDLVLALACQDNIQINLTGEDLKQDLVLALAGQDNIQINLTGEDSKQDLVLALACQDNIQINLTGLKAGSCCMLQWTVLI